MTIDRAFEANAKWSHTKQEAVKAARTILARLSAQSLVTQDIVAGVDNIEVLRAYLKAEEEAQAEFKKAVGDM